MSRTLRVAVQMDPIEHIDISGDTSFAMIEAAQARGAQVYEYQPQHLSYESGRVTARAREVKVQRVVGDHVQFGDTRTLDLATDVDVVLMRQDPPFDMSYITAAHILELLKGQTLVVNDPENVRSCPEKIFPLLMADLMPPTLISRDPVAIADFRVCHRDIIVKPLYGNGGAGVFRLKEDDSNYDSLLETFFGMSREPVMVQAFLPQVAQGDKRIILVDGEVVGGFNRIPKKGQTRSNLHVGGRAEKSDLSDRDVEICERLKPELKNRGLIFAGIDVIAGNLTEINITSPTGVRMLLELTGVDAMVPFWDAVERRL